MAAAVEMNSVLDESMKDVFDWSDAKTPVRDAIWNHFMDADNHDTDKTADEVAPYMTMDEAKLKDEVTKLLKA
ncbi:hypothetical protein [Lactiplantibacillus fabifermentans]|uniref:Uncharacterized protein n=2 Tax=Lactiplantibacillus fabifermentans TaxID=483011 RepID=A0A0R2NNC0_9LACO|nr:hypothetical protein [Lactiplantibacillus fabifermentans]ETY73272.1 hypothetical protein LFAB_13470 [Lactiplantibacillus fabifermentans T30PCM01]KRO26860.1 hypothetical protein DY78_GL000544 [Lactiplantibacillus fabifermentans DSM 21115]